MTSTSPDWWSNSPEGHFPDIEKLLKEFLLDKVGPDVEVTHWLPHPDVIRETIAAGRGYLRIYRTGGRINREQKRDEPKVQFAAFTGSRDATWDLIGFVRDVGEAFEKATVVPGTIHKLQCTGEVVGPQLIPELLQSDRLVPITLEFHTWRPRDLMNQYRQALGL